MYCQKESKITNKSVVTLRLFSAYGYLEDHSRLFPSIIQSLLNDKIPSLASPKYVRDFCFIDDIIRAYIKVICFQDQKRINGEIFNVSSGKQYSVENVLNLICDIMGKTHKALWGKEALRNNEPGFWQADVTKAKKVLNWESIVSMEEGLRLYIEWFKKNKNMYEN